MLAILVTFVQNLPTILRLSWKLYELYRQSQKPEPLVTVEQVKEVSGELIKASTAEERQAVAARIATLWSLRKSGS